MDPTATRNVLKSLWAAALSAVDPALEVAKHLPAPSPSGRIVVIGAGKAAAPMACAAARHYGDKVSGLVVTRYGHGLRAGESSGNIRVIEAGHPLPDRMSLSAGQNIQNAVHGMSKADLLIGLWSGGGSSLLEHPLPGLAFEELTAINRALLISGATIGEMNCVRKHLSAIKGGWLAAAAYPAHSLSIYISDVPGDDASVIASGPMIADPTTQAQARNILTRYRIAIPASVASILSNPAYESPKPESPAASRATTIVAANQTMALDAAAREASSRGYKVLNRGVHIEGEAAEAAAFDARLAIEIRQRGHAYAILGGGELAVTGAGNRSGGPNREYALALAIALKGQPGIGALAADTDGIDGSNDAAGAFVHPDTLARAAALGLDARNLLNAHASGEFFAKLGDDFVTGPTRTNVTDFRAILVDA
jgi:hydroxypyruvate reductase